MSPFAAHGLVEAFDLAVGAGPVGLGGEVADAVSGEQFAQRSVLDVGEGVVGHYPPRGDAVLGKERQRALDEAGDRGGAFVAVELDWAGDVKGRMRNPLVVDGRNFLDAELLRSAGFTFEGIGRAGEPVGGSQEPVAGS